MHEIKKMTDNDLIFFFHLINEVSKFYAHSTVKKNAKMLDLKIDHLISERSGLR